MSKRHGDMQAGKLDGKRWVKSTQKLSGHSTNGPSLREKLPNLTQISSAKIKNK